MPGGRGREEPAAQPGGHRLDREDGRTDRVGARRVQGHAPAATAAGPAAGWPPTGATRTLSRHSGRYGRAWPRRGRKPHHQPRRSCRYRQRAVAVGRLHGRDDARAAGWRYIQYAPGAAVPRGPAVSSTSRRSLHFMGGDRGDDGQGRQAGECGTCRIRSTSGSRAACRRLSAEGALAMVSASRTLPECVRPPWTGCGWPRPATTTARLAAGRDHLPAGGVRRGARGRRWRRTRPTAAETGWRSLGLADVDGGGSDGRRAGNEMRIGPGPYGWSCEATVDA
ncbi:hypothetical protein SVIOM74S_09217 [Streptomyces violarus]